MKKQVLCTAALLPAALAAAQEKPLSENRMPNVILINADDLGYGDLGCFGARNVETPNVDALAAAGVRFTNAYATASVSTPSRYSLLTGHYAWRLPNTDVAPGNAGMIIRPEQYTMADLFKNAGYATAAFGKWHLGLGDKTGQQDWNAPLPTGPSDIGFDHSYIMAATGDRVPCVFIEDGQVADWDPEAPIEVSYHTPFEGEPLAKDHPELLYNLKATPGLGHNQAIVNGIGRIGYMKGGGRALWKDENIADSITVRAVRFIRENRERPFFIYFATNDVHVPRFPHERFRGRSGMGLRGDAIVQFDWSVGEIMRVLDELGLADDTLILLTSDNGPVLDDGYQDEAVERVGDHSPTGGLRGNKYSAYEGGCRIPAIIRWPRRVVGGRTSDALLSHIDLLRSFSSLVGGRLPAGMAPDSRDCLSAWLGEDPQGRDYVIEQSANRTLSVRTAEWKYIEGNDDPVRILSWAPGVETGNAPIPQLYRLSDDPTERRNVAARHPEIVFDLSGIIRRERGKSR